MTKFEVNKEVGEQLKDFIEVTINDKEKALKSSLIKTFDFDEKRFQAKLIIEEVEKFDEIFQKYDYVWSNYRFIILIFRFSIYYKKRLFC